MSSLKLVEKRLRKVQILEVKPMRVSVPCLFRSTQRLRNVVNGKWTTTHYIQHPRDKDPRWKNIDMTRVADEYDVAIVGGGPAGMCAAIRLQQLAKQNNKEVRVCVVEKAPEVGAHILSGAVIDPRGMDELFPDWKNMNSPVYQKVTSESLALLTTTGRIPMPAMPGNPLYNHGNYIVRYYSFCLRMRTYLVPCRSQFRGEYTKHVAIFQKEFADERENVGKKSREGRREESFQRGMELRAKCTIFAEGCRGHLTRQIIDKFKLDANSHPMSYGIGLKEMWQVEKSKHKPGYVEHTLGYPLKRGQYGGSFMYHIEDNGQPLVAIGFVVALDYKDPYINPYQEFQRYKLHPSIRKHLEGGTRIGYGARALNEGGYQTIPKLAFPGGCLIGCTAGLMNVAKLKGVHNAMKSGIVAAEAIFPELETKKTITPEAYDTNLRNSYVVKEMKKTRNIRPSFNTRLGWIGGMAYTGTFFVIGRGLEPWTLSHGKRDHEKLEPAAEHKPVEYPKPDGKITFDLLNSVALSGTNHEENQPCHLTLKDDNVPETVNLAKFAGPEARFCPAGVYEYVERETKPGEKRLQINALNCIHCKTCDIKDPTQNIVWVAPEGGGGPKYDGM
ncbi:Electron transfer flavoprotein-ubiquinone oxidoreductase, mitochondrial [Toxocara canis]|uniref:Electron transfer flavoprotein-ubiquinone oxidoreductase n=2 Tax=Toxocara canis TaxID=6265 RepID=A0A0B2V3Z1_TOXCA|nr:Electron transfer flavoprotein-ubiquinone oxidoreductase, mitochondrial [Toxocara canis]